ncbi:MAG: hypothetical protein ACI8V0_002606 [Pseudohongiellaceae bacterium]|jgi:hypothetical protein
MTFRNKLRLGFLISVLSVPMLPAQLALAGEEQRAPPEARSAGTLGQQVLRAISSIQAHMSPEDPEDEPDMVAAKEELDELYERRYERMNDFEKSTTLSFYTNYYLTNEDYINALRIFEQILTIETLREDQRLRTLRSLGQLYAAEEDWQGSIDNYVTWRELSFDEDPIVFRGLSYAHYQKEEFIEALPYWLSYMQYNLDAGEELDRDDYTYLNGIYFTIEDYDKALELTKSMIVLFDNPTDWLNLSAVYASVEDEGRRVRALNLAYLRGHIDDESRHLNLGQSLAGMDMPLTGEKIIKAGLDAEYVEANEDNLTTLTQMYLIGSDYKNALPSARQVAEMSESGDGYDTLGYIHYVLAEYRNAADAFQSAIDKGELSKKADTYLFLSRSLLELDKFDEALAAAKRSGEAGDEREQSSATNYAKFIEGTQARFNLLATRRADAIDFYETYPPLNR